MNVVAERTATCAPVVQLSEAVVLNPKPERGSLADELDVSFVPMAAVEATSGQMDTSTVRKYGQVKKGYTFFREGDVLFAKITPCMENGKMAVAHGLCNGVGCGSTEFHVLRPRSGVDPHYIYYFVSSARFRAEAAHHMKGAVGQKRVPASFLEQSKIPLPDLMEQRRIVAEIEKQFSRLDEAVANLKRAKANLKRYKAAVLKAAVEGRLVPTEADLARRENRGYETGAQFLARLLRQRRATWTRGGKYVEPVLPDAARLPDLPTGWTWAALRQLGELNRGKSKHRPRDDPKLYGGTYAFIQTGDVRHSQGKICEFNQTYNEFGLQQSRLWPAGTLCITIAANIAETGILAIDACFPDSVVGFLSGDATMTRIVEYFIRTSREELERFAPATAQKNINLALLEKIAVPLPPPLEQNRIVAEVDRRLSFVREVEAAIHGCLLRSERLRQATLATAFSGV